MANDVFIACAQQLALNPDLVRRILLDHSSDEHGRCRAHRNRHEPHPCSIRSLAEMAVRHLRPPVSGHQPVGVTGDDRSSAPGGRATEPSEHRNPAPHGVPTSGRAPAPSPAERREAVTSTTPRAVDAIITPRAVKPCPGNRIGAVGKDLRCRL